VREVVQRAIEAVDRVEFADLAAPAGECAEMCGRPAGNLGYCTSCAKRRPGPLHLPAKPLATMIGRIVETRVRWERLRGVSMPGSREKARTGTLGEVCDELDVDPRSLFGWQHEGRKCVKREVAERVLLRVGLGWSDVWPREDFPELYPALDTVRSEA
jgi:hypothetical protein